MPDIGWYGAVLAIAAAVTAACTVPAKRFAQKVGYVAHPSDRTVHKKPIPYGGGAAMFLGFLVAVLVAAALPPFRQSHMFDGLARNAGRRAGRGRHVRGRPDRRRPRHVGARQDGGAGPGRQHPLLRRRDHVPVEDPAGRLLRAHARDRPVDHGGLGHLPHQRGQPDRRPGRVWPPGWWPSPVAPSPSTGCA